MGQGDQEKLEGLRNKGQEFSVSGKYIAGCFRNTL